MTAAKVNSSITLYHKLANLKSSVLLAQVGVLLLTSVKAIELMLLHLDYFEIGISDCYHLCFQRTFKKHPADSKFYSVYPEFGRPKF